AACDRSEKAYEHGTNGLFTHCLLQVLNSSPRISYAKLFDRTCTKMLAIADRQTPRFEPSNKFDSYELFLRPGNTAEEIRNTLFFKDNVWKVNLGNLHGVPISAGVPAEFAVYKRGDSAPFTYVKARSVGFQDTVVDFEGDPGEEYDARLISLPEAGIPVTASTAFLEKLETLQKDHPTLKSVFASFSTDTDGAAYNLDYVPGQISILRKDGELVKGYAIEEPKEELRQFLNAVDDLDHIAKWERFVALEKSSAELGSGNCKFELILTENSGREIIVEDSSCTIEMYGQNGNFSELPFRLRLTNSENRQLHYAVFYLTEDYAIYDLGTEIIAGTTAQEIFKNTFELAPNIFEERFNVKVVLSNVNIDSKGIVQNKLQDKGRIIPVTKYRGIKGIVQKSLEDWFTKTLSIRLVGIDQQLSADKPLQLPGTAIKILPNPTLQAKVNTTSTSRENARGGDVLGILPRLLDEEVTSFIGAGDGSRGSSHPLVINLEDIQGAEHIRENPLQFEVQQALAPHERLLPITYDGEKIVLLGHSGTQPDGSILVTVDQLPDQQPSAGTRSLGKAVWLYLVKVAGIDKPELRHAFQEGSKIKRSTTGLITKVAGAQRILLVVHGIIGDTRDMARFGLEAADTGRFDLVLTFDYENLNT
ncbi:MAG: hypothetical protein ACOYOO_15970, partial [Saprospiraceae bacterium]